jgi:hypothetical protein
MGEYEMKSWYALPLGVCILVLAWGLQGGRHKQVKTVPVAGETRNDSSWSAPSREVASLRKELAQVQDQLARLLQQQAPSSPGDSSRDLAGHTPVSQQPAKRLPPDQPLTAGQPYSQAGAREAQEQAGGDEAQEILTREAQEREAQERQRIDQFVLHLDDAFHSEPDEGGWAAPVEAGITKDFQLGDWQGNTLAEASCRTTLCRMVVEHENPDAAGTFVTRMGTLQAFADTEAFYQQVTHENGTVTTVVYIARQGHQLPAMPSP